MRTIQIGVLGLGNVGAGLLRCLKDGSSRIATRVGAHIEVRKILVRDRARARAVEFDADRLTTDVHDILGDPEIAVVVELIGGIEPARAHVLAALRAGKHVVSANKALLSAHGEEIFRVADEAGVNLLFEGAVAGGIPVLRSIRDGLSGDRIESMLGIVNGTANYMLDAMTRTRSSYADALARAQREGYAEADPTLDVSGGDAAHKLALLACLGFSMRVDPEDIEVEGIESITAADIRAADRLGYVIRSLAVADLDGAGRPRLRVHPTLVGKDHVFAGVHGAFNAVLVRSTGLGESMYYGQGAGMMPTGVAVASDLVDLCRELALEGRSTLDRRLAGAGGPARLGDMAGILNENYICVRVDNVVGVLGRVASCLGHHGVSIRHMTQDSPDGGVHMNMRIITDAVAESKLRSALAELEAQPEFSGQIKRLRILTADQGQ